MAKMKAMGLENVHAEKWQISRGWTRVSADAELLSPIRHRLTVDSMGWVGSTKSGGEEAEVIPVNLNRLDDEMKNSAAWAGKVLVIVRKGPAPTGPQAIGGFAKFGELLKKAHEAHAVAVIGGEGGSASAGVPLSHTRRTRLCSYHQD